MILGTVIGGLIAGIVGLVTAMYQQERRWKKEEREWYNRLGWLCNRLQTDLHPENPESVMNKSKQREYQATISAVIPILEEHTSKAPADMPNRFFETYSRMIRNKSLIENKSAGSRDFTEYASQISRDATQLEEFADEMLNQTRIPRIRDFVFRKETSWK